MLIHIGRHRRSRTFDEIAFSDLALSYSGNADKKLSSLADKCLDQIL